MTKYMFSAWISHFIDSVRRLDGINYIRCHLLILDNHDSDVIVQVVKGAQNVGLDLISLPGHTSNIL